NAHLRRVNCAFSGYASLEIPLVIQLLTKWGFLTSLILTISPPPEVHLTGVISIFEDLLDSPFFA
ncbi:MAG: hypothetical protein IKD17_00290, partial [Alistipes sp.]|nr:hypothetical protein [Alistipes sp.]